jgi:hypothetical protein
MENSLRPTVSIDLDMDPGSLRTLQQEAELGEKAMRQGQPDMAIGFFSSALAKLGREKPGSAHLTHNLLLAHKLRVEQLFIQERHEEAAHLIGQALRLSVSSEHGIDDRFRRNFANLFQDLGLVCFENRQFDACVACSRRALSIFRSPTYNVNLSNALSILKQPPLLSDLTDRVEEKDLGRHVFIACVPKSGSTFLKNVLSDLTGFKELFAVHAAGQNEHDIYIPCVEDLAAENTVTQQHVRASEANIQALQAFQIRPVVLVRNVFDVVVSQLDFYRNGAYFNSYFRGNFAELDTGPQIDLLIDSTVPWFFQFVASWQLAEKEGRLPVRWVTYEEMVNAKVETVSNILQYYDLGASRESIQRSIKRCEADSKRNRFNVGRSGRGKITLTAEQKTRIIRVATHFSNTDLSIVGL